MMIGMNFGMSRRGRNPFPTGTLSASGLYCDMADRTSLFQGTDEASPVTTAGQTIGRLNWRNAAGAATGVSAQSTSGLRPTWQGDRAVFSAHYLDGTGTPMLGLFRNVSKLFRATRFVTSGIGAGGQVLASWSTGASATVPRFQVGINNGGPVLNTSRRDDAVAVTATNATSIANGTQYVLMEQIDWTAQTRDLWISTDAGSETSILTETGIGTTGNTSNTESLLQRIGASLAAATPFAGSLYKAVADAKLMTADERAALRRWMWI